MISPMIPSWPSVVRASASHFLLPAIVVRARLEPGTRRGGNEAPTYHLLERRHRIRTVTVDEKKRKQSAREQTSRP